MNTFLSRLAILLFLLCALILKLAELYT